MSMVVQIEKELLHVPKEFFSSILVWPSTSMSPFITLTFFPITVTATKTWSRHGTTGPSPKALSMSGVLCDRKMITFGGVLSGKGCNTIHSLDLGRCIFRECY